MSDPKTVSMSSTQEEGHTQVETTSLLSPSRGEAAQNDNSCTGAKPEKEPQGDVCCDATRGGDGSVGNCVVGCLGTLEEHTSTWKSHGVHLRCAICVCVVGGGNIATATAAWLGRPDKNICVHVLTRQPAKWTRNLHVWANPKCRWANMTPFDSNIRMVTDNPKAAVQSANLVLIAAPAHVHLELLQKVAPHVRDGAVVGTAFGQGGFDWAVSCAFGSATSRLSAIFGLQHVPWLARAEVYGHKVEIIGPKEFLCAAVSPPCARSLVQMLIQLCFDQPCKLLPNFLCLTLTPSNQIIHPARYYAIFKDWDGVRAYNKNEISWGLYTEFDDEAAGYLELLDNELQAIKQALVARYPNLDLSTVIPIKERIIEQYGDDVKDRSSLQSVMASNGGYASCRTPVTACPSGGGYQPCIQGRLFQEDIPSGLCVLRGIAEMLRVETPTIDLMIEWHQKWMKVDFLKDGKLNPAAIQLTTAPARYGIQTLDQLVGTSIASGCSSLSGHSSKF